jgi:hypothetical protein
MASQEAHPLSEDAAKDESKTLAEAALKVWTFVKAKSDG